MFGRQFRAILCIYSPYILAQVALSIPDLTHGPGMVSDFDHLSRMNNIEFSGVCGQKGSTIFKHAAAVHFLPEVASTVWSQKVTVSTTVPEQALTCQKCSKANYWPFCC